MLLSAPKSLKTQATFTIKQGTVFRHAAASYFFVEQGKLTYSLSNAPNWLSIHPQTGVVWGKAPLVYTAKTFNVTVCASNNAGKAEWSFFLTVTRETFNKNIDAVRQRYQEQKIRQRLEEYYTPELLEYIYAFFAQHEPQHREEFFNLLREKATELGISLSEQPTYQEFSKLVKTINPNIQSQLMADLPANSPLPHAQVSPNDLQNLFRQGSQPAGALAGPVFNYLAAPSQHIHSLAVKTIFNASVLAVIERQQLNQVKQETALPPQTQANPTYMPPRPQPG